jgi:hypothetical protein
VAGIPLALGSLWGLMWLPPFVGLIIWRLLDEEAFWRWLDEQAFCLPTSPAMLRTASGRVTGCCAASGNRSRQ